MKDECMCRQDVRSEIYKIGTISNWPRVPYAECMKCVGRTYHKCVLCRNILEFKVMRNAHGYALLCREGDTSVQHFCRRVGLTTNEIKAAVTRA